VKDTKDASLDNMALLNSVGRRKARVQDENVFSILETTACVSSSLTLKQKFQDLLRRLLVMSQELPRFSAIGQT
jgi:hypothetical protein